MARASSKLLIGLGAVAGIVLIGIILAGPGGKKAELPGQPPADESAAPPAAQTNTTPSSFFAKRQPGPTNQYLTNGGMGGVSAPSAEIITNWEDKVDEILTANSQPPDKAKEMLAMFRRLPEAGQLEVAKHLSNLLADQDYAPMGQMLADAQLPADVLEALMADVLNRPNRLKLPALLEVARTPQHPKAGDAKEMLGFLLEGDYGEDWAQWQAKIEEWLKENPD